jgi:hypothetical protein
MQGLAARPPSPTDRTMMAHLFGNHCRRARADTDLAICPHHAPIKVSLIRHSAVSSTQPEAAVGSSNDTISTSPDSMTLKGHADYFATKTC